MCWECSQNLQIKGPDVFIKNNLETPFKVHAAYKALSPGLGVDGALNEVWSLSCLSDVLGLQFLMARSGISPPLLNPFSTCCVSCALFPSQIPLPENRITSTVQSEQPPGALITQPPNPWIFFSFHLLFSCWMFGAGGHFHEGVDKGMEEGHQSQEGAGSHWNKAPPGRMLKLKWDSGFFSLWPLLPLASRLPSSVFAGSQGSLRFCPPPSITAAKSKRQQPSGAQVEK